MRKEAACAQLLHSKQAMIWMAWPREIVDTGQGGKAVSEISKNRARAAARYCGPPRPIPWG